MTSPIERARKASIASFYHTDEQADAEDAIDRFLAALAEEGLWPPEEIRRKALEEAAHWCEQEDVDNDPDDLYSGRVHRAAAIRALNSKEKE